uniref:Tensin-4 n=1 Tax=Bactrocera dorsalis TaxID=27457 RepID=A0A034W2Y7_BACDO
MRNMGRIFQYNRFVGSEEAGADNTKDTQTTGGWKNNKPQQQFGANCPAYAELYPAYACTASMEVAATPTAATAAAAVVTTTATAAATTMTSRSLDLALRKYQQWSSKFLPTTTNSNNNSGGSNTMPVLTTEKHTTIATMPVATNADCVTHLSTSSSSQKSNSCSHSCSYSTATNTSGYYSRLTLVGNTSDLQQPHGELQQQHCWSAADGDRELLVSAGKRPKVYDCMKDFLRRKLFQQRHGQQQQHQQREREREQQRAAQMAATLCKSDTEEDVTSDYDEVDMLDSSYNADEEDASDCSSQCTCPLESDIEETPPQQHYACTEQQQKHGCTPQKSISPQKSMLSLNCWQNITQYTDSTTEPEEDEDVQGEWGVEDADYQHVAEDSDAGISDCCQLISEKSSPTKQRKRQLKQQQKLQQKPKQKFRYNRNSDDGSEEAELLASSWYQPRITTKAALERLQQAPPGTFLLRRKSRSYELCLRVETKVKHFVVVSLADNHYKLKGAKKQFTSLKALVTHHSVMAEQLPLTLALPREYECKGSNAYGVSAKWAASETFDVSKRTLRSLRYADDFDTYESLQILGLLQDWQCEANEF